MIYITMIILLNQSGNELALTSSPARKTKKQTARFIWTTEEKKQAKKKQTDVLYFGNLHSFAWSLNLIQFYAVTKISINFNAKYTVWTMFTLKEVDIKKRIKIGLLVVTNEQVIYWT